MASGNGSKRKRSYPHGYGSVMPLLSGVAPSLEDKDNDFVCPICFDLLKEAHMTRCGHTFCHECIMKCFETNSRCPKCNCDLENRQGDIFPNFLLNELVAKHKIKIEAMSGATNFNTTTSEKSQEILSKILDPNSKLSLNECEYMISTLTQRKDELLNQSLMVEYKLLTEFLTQLKRIKDDELIRIRRETSGMFCNFYKIKCQSLAIFVVIFETFLSKAAFHSLGNPISAIEAFGIKIGFS